MFKDMTFVSTALLAFYSTILLHDSMHEFFLQNVRETAMQICFLSLEPRLTEVEQVARVRHA